ncbi:leucyl aminopeptidase family protein [Deferribacterales bacterium Es71-Z0220]|jgi:leucyl aminopeptidase|uniref:leucyl aminopeptidase family protein n=1 Tax=Deferrivibrio essentukiensis TaxID=2880922 RepID=UPI001F61B08C|nr:leucyl aminopeptidase family protein [Deferrivibrio essentukiensis]MBZ4672927.1 leucyl aminopeptidase [Deferribacteraceae bacterium]MCB4204858.1 leucyl aminopeptidase family protein [Deferrivibrio essentukiensis]
MKFNIIDKNSFAACEAVFLTVIDNFEIINKYFNKKDCETIKTLLSDELLSNDEPKIKEIILTKNKRPIKLVLGTLPKLFEVQDLLKLGFLYGEYIKSNKMNTSSFVMIEDTLGKKNYTEFTKLLLEGTGYGLYSFNTYKSKPEFEYKNVQINIYTRIKRDNEEISSMLNEVEKIISSIYVARDLINTPANELTPEIFCQVAQKLNLDKCTITIIKDEDLKKEGLNLIYTVGAGSKNRPALLKIYYKGNSKSNNHIAIVGKGVTFDSGGTNLKPTGHIETMKTDMAGAATALGIAKLLNELNKKINVSFYIPLVENTIGYSAYRPGDIIKSKSGKTVEVLNTDAEGRLILADALSVAVEEKPDTIIDLATLTGACVVALGSHCAAFFANDDELAESIMESSEYTGEDVWMLPLYKDYKKRIKSKIADLQNISTRKGEAGTIIGALFLNEFVENTPWVHLDIAGTAFIEEKHPFYGEGASGFGIRLLYDFLDNIN